MGIPWFVLVITSIEVEAGSIIGVETCSIIGVEASAIVSVKSSLRWRCTGRQLQLLGCGARAYRSRCMLM